MIVVISSSSPRTSVAVLDCSGKLLHAASAEAGGQASGHALSWLRDWGVELAEVNLWAADIGPGGFTGTRVGVMLAKTLAWSFGKPTAGITSFDLIDRFSVVCVPGRKGQWVRRVPGQHFEVVDTFEGAGYWCEAPMFPDAARAEGWAHEMQRLSAHELMPLYGLAPSISEPKKPFQQEARR